MFTQFNRFSMSPATLIALAVSFFVSCGQEPAFKEELRQNQSTTLGSDDLEGQPGVNSGDSQGVSPGDVGGDGSSNYGSNPPGSHTGHNGCAVVNPVTGECWLEGWPGPGYEGDFDYTLVIKEMIQQGPGSVDILWVVDSSGSMSEEQAYLAQNFSSFIQAMQVSGHDFQTAVTSTDVCEDSTPPLLIDRACPSGNVASPNRLRGSFRGAPGSQIVRHDDHDILSRFSYLTNVGTSGSGYEHGLWGAKLAVDKVLSGENDPLIRDDAFLAIIVVSDEEDDGIGLWEVDAYSGINFAAAGLTQFRWTDDDMIGYLNQAKGQGKYSISAITGTRLPNGSMCTSAHSQPLEEGTQYIKAAQKTGGIIQSICEPDWSTSLTNIGLDLNAQITQISLEEIPDVATMRVYVDDELVTTWSYIESSNAIRFNNDHIPEEGSTIRVEYITLSSLN